MAKKWAKFPRDNAYMFDVAGLKKNWA